MTYSSAHGLWTTEQQRMVANWDSILQQWDESLHVPSYVRIVTENLRMASDPNHPHDPPLTHFLRFFSYEDAALKWFIYETVAVEWLWGNKRMDYLQNVISRVDLDTQFPVFPGSPRNSSTIRQFLLQHLSPGELRQLPGVIPPLPASPSSSASPRSSHITIRLLRKPPKDSAKKDDIITISKEEDSYRVRYQDKESKTTPRSIELSQDEVIEYFSTMFRMLKEDADPFDSVQVLFPSMPSVLLSLDTFDSYTRNLVYDGLTFTMNHWPSC